MKSISAAFFSIALATLAFPPHAALADARFISLPVAPVPVALKKPVFGIVDWSLVGAVAAGRALDFTSTEECLRRPWQQCHEVELPTALVRSKAAFLGFEVGAAALGTWSQYELTRHGHRRLAWVSRSVEAGFLYHAVENNYRLATTPMHLDLRGRTLPPLR